MNHFSRYNKHGSKTKLFRKTGQPSPPKSLLINSLRLYRDVSTHHLRKHNIQNMKKKLHYRPWSSWTTYSSLSWTCVTHTNLISQLHAYSHKFLIPCQTNFTIPIYGYSSTYVWKKKPIPRLPKMIKPKNKRINYDFTTMYEYIRVFVAYIQCKFIILPNQWKTFRGK